jgi:hypothetical protein
VRLDDADEQSLMRAVRTVHATHAADKKNNEQRTRNETTGRDVFRERKTGDAAAGGRDAWIHRLEHMQDATDGEDLNA